MVITIQTLHPSTRPQMIIIIGAKSFGQWRSPILTRFFVLRPCCSPRN
ncbi:MULTISPECIES: hypothetical protein [unclassified Synechocystis]|nr:MULTISPECIES: hypothetical protein [unclassified Synechocystis]MBD2617182.1 hypothetical protein [Synechocystis sp. FACHB-898]MBD2638581.1 hypothetical protein [Synechocystis sp. FACHB-908]MBD2659610.1 hypothetical protein [Synechocystis sp. FACHB-929]NHL97689.1 hypothetical protein [Synechocystis sp. PCC 6803]QWO80869.1 hypothetical protein KBZ93_01665 [Synechocystis sp. PCC 6803]